MSDVFDEEDAVDVVADPPSLAAPQNTDPYATDDLPYDLSSDELALLVQKLHPGAVHGVDFWCAHKVAPNSADRVSAAIIVKWDLSGDKPTPEEIAALAVTHADDIISLGNVTALQVDIERDRRIDAGFTLNGVVYQSRPEDRENIAGAATAAFAAIVGGAQPGDFRWHGGEKDFEWIAADNSTHPLDAQSTFALGQTAMAHKEAHIFAARTLKDMNPIPADYATNAAYWP